MGLCQSNIPVLKEPADIHLLIRGLWLSLWLALFGLTHHTILYCCSIYCAHYAHFLYEQNTHPTIQCAQLDFQFPQWMNWNFSNFSSRLLFLLANLII